VAKPSRRQIAALRRDLEHADNLAAWRSIASELDEHDGGAAWRADDESPYYDAASVRRSLMRLRALELAGDPMALADHLHVSLHRHLKEITDPGLYQRSPLGTKRLIEDYLDAVVDAVHQLCDVDIPGLSDADRLALVEREAHNVGRPALLLSGGASLGLFHIGVLKALWQSELLPNVVSGSSTGSMIAGGLCTRTDQELGDVFAAPGQQVYTRVFRMLRPSDMRHRKVMMSQEQLLEAIRANMHDDTFAEAHARTGRTLCMSVSPIHARQKPRLLSYRTSPDVLVTSASLCSCAIPGMFPPASLLQRRAGETSEYVAGERWIDGTVQSDLPTERLSRLLNVNYTVVSQTNAHLLPFSGARNRRGVVPFLTDLVASSAHSQGLQLLSVARRHTASKGLRRVLEQAHGIADQRFAGDVTIHPPITPWNYSIVLRNASAEDLERLVRQGERATWPRLAEIDIHTRVSRALEAAVKRLRARV